MVEIINKAQLVKFVGSLEPSPAMGILLIGDRLVCCDEAVVLKKGGEIAGLATIAPDGEQMSGQPTIVALYVLPAYRRQGYGRQLMEAVVRRCFERGFENVRVDVMSAHAMKIIQALPDELKAGLDVHDLGAMMDMFPG